MDYGDRITVTVHLGLRDYGDSALRDYGDSLLNALNSFDCQAQQKRGRPRSQEELMVRSFGLRWDYGDSLLNALNPQPPDRPRLVIG